MFESCRAHFRVRRAGGEHGVVRNLRPNVGESHAWDRARDSTDRLAVERQLVARGHVALDVEDAEAAIDLAAVVLPRDRLLSGIAAFREADVSRLEAGLRGQHTVVELRAPARDTGLDPPALELCVARLVTGRPLVEDLVAAEHEPGLVLLGPDLHLRRETRPLQLRAHGVPEL